MRFAIFSKARIAQLAEQLICNQQVLGSNPSADSIPSCPRVVAHQFRDGCVGLEKMRDSALKPPESYISGAFFSDR